MSRKLTSRVVLCFVLLLAQALTAQSPPAKRSTPNILEYIDHAWGTLTRQPVSCEAMVDPKLPPGESVLYFPAEMKPTPQALAAAKRCNVRIEQLPQKITAPGTFDLSKLKRNGLLYLPNEYVVPGGRFNEMYGWDSYFIILGLLESGRRDLARGMVENFAFEIEHYGSILNANRTYYLTRSQPPFFTSMVLAVWEANTKARHKDLAWLARMYADAERDHAMWTTGAHLAGDTGLSRYWDFGEGPVPEEEHNGYQYYKDAAEGLTALGLSHAYRHVAGPGELVVQTYTTKNSAEKLSFDADFYKGDRALRESGFDITNRFMPYGAETHHFAPVGLNSLLYKSEIDLGEIASILGKPAEAKSWQAAARTRRAAIDKYLYATQGLMPARGYYDYDFVKKTSRRYPFATTFYPLWTGAASSAQAAEVIKALPQFLMPGGIQTSTTVTGLQWDAPYGWAPLQMLTVDGLRRYGYNKQADEAAKRWLSLIVDEYAREHTIREKYDVVHRSADVDIQAGYRENVVGFGWTNGVFLRLLHELSQADQRAIVGDSTAKAATTH